MVRVLVLVTVAVALAGSLLTPRFARPTYACSVGPDYNPVADSDVIVAGRVLGWERGSSAAAPSPPAGSPFVPIRVMLRVEQRFKGSTPAEIVVIDHASLHELPGQSGWAGGAGACGSFDADPTGMYAVMGLTRNADGTYQAGRPRTFYLGDAPPAPGYEWRIARIASYDPVAVQAARFGVQSPDCPVSADACAFGLHVQRWLELREYDAIVSLLSVEEVVCPGPAPMGLGGPYPLCDGSAPGERRYGTPITRPQSEGGVGGVDFFRETLTRRDGTMRLVSVGCPDTEADGGRACGDRFSLIFAAPDCPARGGCTARPVTAFLVDRQVSGQFRLATIIFAAEAAVPRAALAGGRVDANLGFFVTGPATFATFFPWNPPTVRTLPASGTGGVVRDASVKTILLPLSLLVAFGGLGAFVWGRLRGGQGD